MIKEPCLYCGQAVDGTAGRARLRRRLSGLLVGVALGFPFPGRAQDSALPPNPFAGFETHHLANGLKVWLKRLPGDPVVSVSLAVPFGSDNDPPGKEQLAHFTEHMLFSDHLGRNEQEIKREIEELGGLYNAATRADETFYFVRIGKEHALFAIEWLYRIVSPHSMDPEIVDKQREPVALELGARPRQFFDWLWAHYINPPALRPPGFWEREFGIKTRASRARASLTVAARRESPRFALRKEDFRGFQVSV